MGAPVLGSWKACSLALPPFAPSWETLEDVWSLPEMKPALESQFAQHACKEMEEATLSTVEQSQVEMVAS